MKRFFIAITCIFIHAGYRHSSAPPSLLGMNKRRRFFKTLRPVPVLTLSNNDGRYDKVVLNTLIAEFIALGAEHHMTGKVLETQDFYEFPLCSNTIASTWTVLGNMSTAAARTSEYPSPRKRFTSLARVPGLQET